MGRQIIIEPYNPHWQDQYAEEKSELCRILGTRILDIQHFGSTSIPGLAAKPTIDILITTDKISEIDNFNATMCEHGYIVLGENGTEGRRYFVKTLPGRPEIHTHHVHIFEPDHPQVAAQLLFRDYLRAHPEAVQAYQELKMELAGKFRDNPRAYTEAKTEFITGVLERARKEMQEYAESLVANSAVSNLDKIARTEIINRLSETLHEKDFIHALWLEGADAIGTADEFSDLDIWLDVEDGYEDTALQVLKSTLSTLAPLDFVYEKRHVHPQIRQLFFHLARTSEYLIIDVCIQSHSRKVEFTIGNKDEVVQVLFDKANVIQYKYQNFAELNAQLNERVAELQQTFPFFLVWVRKEIHRNNYLEAWNYYQIYVLKPLVELCRLRYEPTKSGFYLKHVKRDLPPDVVHVLEDLHHISSIEDIAQKLVVANEFFDRMLREIWEIHDL